MKVLLINPSFTRLRGTKDVSETVGPLWMACLAAGVAEAGFSVRLYDANAAMGTKMRRQPKYDSLLNSYNGYTEAVNDPGNPVWVEVGEKVRREAPDVVGISALSPTCGAAYMTGRICREAAPGAKIVFGGYHPTIYPEETLERGAADAVVRGEGESAFRELIVRYAGGNGPEDVEGVSFANGNGVVHNPDRALADKLDEFPSCANYVTATASGKAPAQFGRGCPFGCKFCCDASLWRRRVRYHSAERMVSDIERIVKNREAREFSFVDGTFNASRKKTVELCELLIRNRTRILWDALVRAENLDDETLRLYRRAGCTQLNLGVESGSDRVLSDLNKKSTVESTRESLGKIRKHGIAAVSFFCIGMPVETADDMRATRDTIEAFPHDFVIMHVYTPLPGSAFFNELMDEGRLSPDHDYDMFGYRSGSNHFAHLVSDAEFESLRSELSAIVDKVNRRGHLMLKLLVRNLSFYLRFPRIFFTRALKYIGY